MAPNVRGPGNAAARFNSIVKLPTDPKMRRDGSKCWRTTPRNRALSAAMTERMAADIRNHRHRLAEEGNCRCGEEAQPVALCAILSSQETSST